MKLLIITQAVDINNPILGFFHSWIKIFSNYCEKITVICLEKGEYHLPEKVKVLSLGKEGSIINDRRSIICKIIYILKFYKFIWQERKNYDAVFVHMNPIYIVLGGFFWRIVNKKIALWYTHRKIDLKLRIAEKFSNNIFTAARESFTLKTNKLKVLGHGIEVKKFKNPGTLTRDSKFTIISVGRITPIKNLDTLINAAAILKNRDINFKVLIIGSPIQKIDYDYFEKLKKIVLENNLEKNIIFIGSVPSSKIMEYLWKSDLSINLSPSGGVDKAVFESIASGLPVIVSNKGFEDYFGEYSKDLLFEERNERELSEKIIGLMNNPKIEDIKKYILNEVLKRSDLDGLILRIVNILK